MIRIGESDFLWAFDAISEMARKDPVTITRHGHDRLVVMSAEEYRRLQRREAQGRTGSGGVERPEAKARAAE